MASFCDDGNRDFSSSCRVPGQTRIRHLVETSPLCINIYNDLYNEYITSIIHSTNLVSHPKGAWNEGI